MLHIHKSIPLAFLSFFALTSCQKELSFENGNTDITIASNGGSNSGTAVFSLNGAPNSCEDHVVGGTYSTGTSLCATNAVAVNVTVISPGSFVISTATINGITFTAAGNFDSTGRQTVILTGSGIPTATGTFDFKPGSSWCSFPVTVTTPVTTAAVGALDCSLAWSQGSFPTGMNLTDSTKIFIPANITTAGSYSINSAPINGVTFSGSGELEQGAHTITLTGHGIPVGTGYHPLTINLGGSVCSFDIYFD